MSSEYARLETIASDSQYSAGLNELMVFYSYRVLKRWIRGPLVLELGPAEGHMTDLLVADGFDLVVVEGSRRFCDLISSRHPSVSVFNSIFEEFVSDLKFDTILLGHVLEHVEDPVDILRRTKEWLRPGGRVVSAVPNSRSLHRQAAVIMGLLDQENDLNESDQTHGHRRVFDPESFRSIFAPAGLRIDFFGGYWLKPLSNGQIAKNWTPEMIDAFVKLGERYPDIAGEIYTVAG